MTKDKFSFELEGTHYNIDYEKGPSIQWHDRKNFPKDKIGVYVAYDDSGEVLYVGKTWNQKGFFGRLTSSHEYFKTFEKECEHIDFFYLENKLYILMFERAKILQFDPVLNRDDAERIIRSQNFMNNVTEQYGLYQFYVFNDQAIIDEMEKRNITDKQMLKLFNKKYRMVKKEVSIESFLFETRPDYFSTSYFCSNCKDKGEVENDFGEMEFCECEIGDNLCFKLHGRHINE